MITAQNLFGKNKTYLLVIDMRSFQKLYIIEISRAFKTVEHSNCQRLV